MRKRNHNVRKNRNPEPQHRVLFLRFKALLFKLAELANKPAAQPEKSYILCGGEIGYLPAHIVILAPPRCEGVPYFLLGKPVEFVADKAGHGGNSRQRKDYPRVERAENAQPDRRHRKCHDEIHKLPHHSLNTLAVSVAGVACFLVAVHDIGIFKVFEINCHDLAVLFA